MRYLLSFLFFILFFSTAIAQDSVKVEKYYSQSLGGLCSHTIFLYSDHTFKSEHGCEASSNISFGKWRQSKDTITFEPIDIRAFRVIGNVVSSKTSGKYLTVKIFNNDGTNITEEVLVGQFVKGIGLYNMWLDSSKTAWMDYKREDGIILFKTLSRIFKQKVEVFADTMNNFEITLTFSDKWLLDPNAVWDKNVFSLIRQKNKLVSLFPDQFSDGNLIVTEYLKKD